jgi:pseudo-response regulator 7
MPVAIPIPPPGIIAYDGVSGAYAPAMYPAYYAHPGAWIAAPAQHMAEHNEVYSQSAVFQEQNSVSGHVSQGGHQHQRSHHHQGNQYHHHHHHHPNATKTPGTLAMQEEQQQTVTNAGSGAPCCASGNMGTTGLDGPSGSSNGYGSNGNGNGSMNGSASGSNNGHTNGQSGAGVTPTANDNSGNIGGSGVDQTMDGMSAGNGICSEQMRFARREAALNKFRQKRKERCFEKKVIYFPNLPSPGNFFTFPFWSVSLTIVCSI